MLPSLRITLGQTEVLARAAADIRASSCLERKLEVLQLLGIYYDVVGQSMQTGAPHFHMRSICMSLLTDLCENITVCYRCDTAI